MSDNLRINPAETEQQYLDKRTGEAQLYEQLRPVRDTLREKFGNTVETGEEEPAAAAEQSDEELTEASGDKAGDEDTREQKGGSE